MLIYFSVGLIFATFTTIVNSKINEKNLDALYKQLELSKLEHTALLLALLLFGVFLWPAILIYQIFGKDSRGPSKY